jgi:arginyl-tRNA synthetase
VGTLQTLAAAALNTAAESAFPDLAQSPEALQALPWERPKNPAFGDYAVNVSPLAKVLKLSPPAIATALAEALKAIPQTQAITANPVGGFLNLTFNEATLNQALLAILQAEHPGQNMAMADQRILLEYVSANPTGPLHIGHGRWAALGNALQRIWQHCGAQVWAEFYINDAGVQVHNISLALALRVLEVLQQLGQLPGPLNWEGVQFPYPGEYVTTLAKAYLSQPDQKQACLDVISTQWESHAQAGPPDPMALASHLTTPALQSFARDTLLDQQKALLGKLGVPFDRWFSEKAELHEPGLVQGVIPRLKDAVYTQEGATWFAASRYGDEKDRVLIKSDGEYTYLTADIAYHDLKFRRQNAQGQPQFNRIVNIWGADHHGYIPRMRAALQALGHDTSQFEVLLGQLVNLLVDGESVRMGKRRKMVTLQDVVDEVGVDAVRFFMVSKSADTALDFDVDLATSATQDNPVFYVQYAHARCCSIVRNATQPSADGHPAVLSPEAANFNSLAALDALWQDLAPDASGHSPALLIRQLILHLDSLDTWVINAAELRAPHILVRYSSELAGQFHSLYNRCRMITDTPAVTQSRMALVVALQRTLAQAWPCWV